MRAGSVVGATGKSAIEEILIEPQALSADAAHQFSAQMLIEAGSINCIEVPDDWPVGLEPCIKVAAGTPSHFALDPEITLDERIAAEV